MSYSTRVKSELMTIIPEKQHCLKAEIAGILDAGGREDHPKNLDPLLAVLKSHLKEKEFDLESPEILQRPCCKKAFIRGLFLSCGSVSDPEKLYHLELVFANIERARGFRDLLRLSGIPSKIIERKGRQVVYLKEGDLISEFFALTQANTSLLEMENIRVYKDVRNTINRRVNCETANLEKTVSAAMEQKEAISFLQEKKLLGTLAAPLRTLAELRLANPESSLKELGEMMDPPVSKSGVNHRMRKLLKIAEEEKL